jgi:carboxypeptidase PM20D1
VTTASTPDAVVGKLQALVRIPTVSYGDEDAVDAGAFARFRDTLADQFPRLHAELEGHLLLDRTLLFRWHGTTKADPVVLMAHQDVVPVDEAGPWPHPPFSGTLADGAVWGRGTLDDKGPLVALCEAVERLLERGFSPARDVWLLFGAREEVSGVDAQEAAAFLAGRGVRPWFVLDEGGAVAHQAFPGFAAPLGVLGVAEKGTTTFEIRAEGRGGHSSTPARNGPTARIARAVVRLEKRPFPARLPAPTVEMFRRLAPQASPLLRPLLQHVHRLAPLVARGLAIAGPEPAALARTTMAVTSLQGSPARNVVASSATATVNLRLLPGDSVAAAEAHLRKAIRDDSLSLRLIDANEPSPLSPVDDPAFGLLADTVSAIFPDAVPTPYVMLAATDSRFLAALCPRIYRFAPLRMTKHQRESIHGHGEHVRVRDLLDGVRWFETLLTRLDPV